MWKALLNKKHENIDRKITGKQNYGGGNMTEAVIFHAYNFHNVYKDILYINCIIYA